MAATTADAQALVLCEGWLVQRTTSLLPAAARFYRIVAVPGGSGPVFAGYADATCTSQFIQEPVAALRGVEASRSDDNG